MTNFAVANDAVRQATGYDDTSYPVSATQDRLLILDQMDADAAHGNLVTSYLVSGRFDETAFLESLRLTVLRHESLRTTFHLDGPQVRAVVGADAVFQVARQSRLATQRVAEFVQAVGAESFRPAVGPLIRCGLADTDTGGHVVVVCVHRLVADEVSLRTILADMSATYAHIIAGRAQAFGPAVPYSAHVAAQRAAMATEEHAASLAARCTELRGGPSMLELPTDAARPRVRTAKGAAETVELGRETANALRGLAASAGTSLPEVLLAGYAAFLGRLSRSSQVVVGVEHPGRGGNGAADSVGPYIDVFPVVLDLGGDPTVVEMLDRAHRAFHAAREYRTLPFGSLVQALVSGSPELSYDPVCQVAIALDPAESGDVHLALAGATVQAVPADPSGVTADMRLAVRQSGGGLKLELTYRSGLFLPDTVRRWARNLRGFLSALPEDHQCRVGAVPMVTGAEREELVASWNDTGVAIMPGLVHDIVAVRARQWKERPAVGCRDVVLNYSELMARADSLARYLRGRGVGPEVVVGLCLTRSVEMAVAVLAVLRAGGAYLPLDPGLPAARLSFMVSDSAVRLIVTQQRLAEVATPLGPPLVIVDGADAEAIEAAGDGPRTGSPVTGQDLAYIIYTSGSTGQPKGVAVEHGSLFNLALTQGPQFGITADSRVLQFAAFSFDVSVSDMFFSWVVGAYVQIAAEDERLGAALHERLRASRITDVTLPPAAVATLPWAPGTLPDLTTLVVGGEAFSSDLVHGWARDRRVINAYGPTESTVWTTLTGLRQGDTPIIGKPLANLQVYVLDRSLQPVPVGVIAELFIGGVGVVRGYVNRPGLTAERFIADPFGPPGSRMYCTGDLVRWRGDGNLEFVGRQDGQVKVRGFRIELGEIEESLRRHAEVAQVAVLARRDGDDDAAQLRLVAYVQPRNGQIHLSALRPWLRDRLPGYMVPEVFVPISQLPTTRAGKIDRAALPAPGTERPDMQQRYVAPRTSIEERIAAIWAAVLGVDRVGVVDDFFDLGGNSLHMMAVRDHVTEAFPGVGLALTDLFLRPTVEGLAVTLEQNGAVSSPVASAGKPDDYAVFGRFRAALPVEALNGVMRAAVRMQDVLDNGRGLAGSTVMVAYGGGKDSSYALAFVRGMQLSLSQIYGDTFRLRVVTIRHAGMPSAVMENIDRVYRALEVIDDQRCELLLIDDGVVVPYKPNLPLPRSVVERGRADILMSGHRAAGDGRPTFCNACNLNMVRGFAIAAGYGSGVDVIVTGDSPEEQRSYYVWMSRLARNLKVRPKSTNRQPFGRFLEMFHGVSHAYLTDIHGVGSPGASPGPELGALPGGVTFFSIYADTEYKSEAHWDFLTSYLGFAFDDLAFSFTESDCGNPGLMAHLRGLKAELRYGRSYEVGLAEYVDFAIELMRKKDFPEHLIEFIRRRYADADDKRRMREAMDSYARVAHQLTEEQLVCMVFAPFVGQGAALDAYLTAVHPELSDRVADIRALLSGVEVDDELLRIELERISGLSVAQLRVLYAAEGLRSDTAESLLDMILSGDPHKQLISTQTSREGPVVQEMISGR